MIWESSYWKDDLLRSAKQLRRRLTRRRWQDVSGARVEQTVMLGFYAVRKLIEANKLSESLVDRELALMRFPVLPGARVTRLNRLHVWDLYDLGSPERCSRSLVFVCNQLVHSYMFSLAFSEQGMLEAVWFASDRERNKGLYCMSIEHIITVFEEVGGNYPSGGKWGWSQTRLDYDSSGG